MSQASSVAAIVASGSILNQTGGVQSTLFTPATAGLFRVGAYIEGNVLNLEALIQYTDDEGSQSMGQNGLPWGANVVIRSAAGSPIKLSVSIPSGVSNPNFSVYYTVEALQ